MRYAGTIETVLADADGFYKRYVKDVEELHEKKSWPGKIKRAWCIAASLQYILLEKYKMLIQPHKLQLDFGINCTQSIRGAKSTIIGIQSKMSLKPCKDTDQILCYLNFAEAYLTREPFGVLSGIFDEARENYEEKKEFYEKECGGARYKIAAMCLLDAGLGGNLVSKTFGTDKDRIRQWGYKV
jgi:hypothetical protein